MKCFLFLICLVFVFFIPDKYSIAQGDDHFLCLSLNQCLARINEGDTTEIDIIRSLGHISDPIGFVIDTSTEEIILIGKPDPSVRLSLDDYLVMLRAAYLPEEDNPGVSLEPVGNNAKKMIVKYSGQIENTNAGKVCYDTDYLVKQMDIGYPTGSINIPSPYSEKKAYLKDKILRHRYTSRLYFYPSGLWFDTTQNAMFLHNCSVAMGSEFIPYKLNERLGLPKDLKKIAAINHAFANNVTEHLEDMEDLYPVLKNYRSLLKLFALAKLIAKKYRQETFREWYAAYQIAEIPTPKFAELAYSDDFPGFAEKYYVEGAVSLSTPDSIINTDPSLLALRLERGKVTALEEACLSSRPNDRSLSWSFYIQDETFHTSVSYPHYHDYIVADYLVESGQYSKALLQLNDLLSGNIPDQTDLLIKRARTYLQLKKFDLAAEDLEKVKTYQEGLPDFWMTYGELLEALGQYDSAIEQYDKVLAAEKLSVEAGIRKAEILLAQNKPEAAEITIDSVLKKEPYNCSALTLQAAVLELNKDYHALFEMQDHYSNVCPHFSENQLARSSLSLENLSPEIRNIFSTQPKMDTAWVLKNTIGVNVGLNYDQYLYPSSVFIFLPDGAFTIGFPISTRFILNNNLQLELVAPVEFKSIIKLYELGRVIGLGAGLGNIFAGAYYIPYKPVGKRPFTLLNLHYLSNIHASPVNRWIAGSRLSSEKVVGRSLRAFILGAKVIFPVHRFQVTSKGTFSFVKSQKNNSNRQGLSIGLRLPFRSVGFLRGISTEMERNWQSGSGFGYIANKVKSFRLTLEMESGDFVIGRMTHSFPGGQSADFFNFSFTINHNLFEKKYHFKR